MPVRLRRSLALRLLAVAAIWLAAALGVGGWLLSALFERHVNQAYVRQLEHQLASLAAALDWSADGRLVLNRSPADPRYELPYSGAYWQARAPGALLRSRSLWDTEMPATVLRRPRDAADAPDGIAEVRSGPNHQSLLVVSRQLVLASADTPVEISVALDRTELRAARRSFDRTLAWSLTALGLGLMLAVAAQVRFGLAPLARLRRALGTMQARREARLGGAWPAEVEPLVNEINALLARNAQALERSRRQAADLAHAVKTPLAVLANEAAALPGAAAQAVSGQVEAMRRQVDRHLARARAAGAAAARGERIDAAPAVRELTRALARLHRERDLELTVDGGGHFAGDRQDLVELLGNLLDNACQWARTRVRVTLREDAGVLEILVEDDGAGLPPEAQALATARFGRLDEAAAGSGLGLAIVTEIAALYDGSLALATSPLGGLAARLRLPAGQP
ncbi:sensor histidine kinase [Cupriavidus taiwanensis]|uniref:sensor histidine kinase n=1 Tax=Cupriavidus taiwanensis TaxID=164546 RepID=UPI000E104944|nr:sensor histidine kinase [Cupriavidus taiwanensis]SOY61561.1 putative sensor histidine kinase [Cupriavidus taiwanensis]SOY62619.1 putative sensor histidine kinase [Cupriavidus taiwanensis]SOY98055.1 putative sensor histidine kinase [Cupriavidus taiwanensis]SOZ68377.1 putative sensor histidine kinase [Cupriavidus taiwanensis]SOZ84976.1 putative sensor histidine kinase [Cupriavidus taiwanensis]